MNEWTNERKRVRESKRAIEQDRECEREIEWDRAKQRKYNKIE